MKLAIIRKRYTPFGGAERFIVDLTQRLVAQNIEITLISSTWNGPSVAGVRWIRADAIGLTRYGRERSFQRSVQRVLSQNKFDIVQSHERVIGADIYRLGDGIHRGWLDRYRGDLSSWRKLTSRLDPFHNRLLSLESIIARDAKCLFVANSQMIKDELIRYYGTGESQIRIIRNGVDENFFRPPLDAERQDSRGKFKVHHNAKVVSAIGSGYERKGFFNLVKSLTKLPEHILFIAGKDKLQGKLQLLVNQLGLSDRVRLLGGTNDVRSIYWASDVFCLPSLYDPSSNAVLEALSSGLPVVTTEHVGTGTEINQWGAGKICLRDPVSIADAIKSTIDHQAIMSKLARLLAEKFSQEEVIREWQSLYAHIIASRLRE
jgi:UDP-glucose:(heptosyl)LPS alpha-1,3-glucosyltransferase